MTVNFFNFKLFFANDEFNIRHFVSCNGFLYVAIFDNRFFNEVLCAPHAINDMIDIAPASEGHVLEVSYMPNREGIQLVLPLDFELSDVCVGTKGDVERLHVFGMVIDKRVGTDTANGEGVPRLINANTGLNLLRGVAHRIYGATHRQSGYQQNEYDSKLFQL